MWLGAMASKLRGQSENLMSSHEYMLNFDPTPTTEMLRWGFKLDVRPDRRESVLQAAASGEHGVGACEDREVPVLAV